MVEERSEVVYNFGYGYSNPCRYLQEVFRGFLRCLGLENQEEERKESDSGGGGGSSDSGQERDGDGGGGEVDDPPATSPSDDPSTMDPTDEPVSATVRRRPPPRGPISSGGPGQTN